MKKIRKFTVVFKPDEGSRLLSEEIKNRMLEKKWIYEEESPEFVFVVGGDGTFIRAVHDYVDINPIYYPIHTGTLGFVSEFEQNQVDAFLEGLEKECTISEYPLLCTKIHQQTIYGINEIRIENPYHTQKTEVVVNGRSFETLRGSGVCVSTQAGSTAYNRSLGGSVLANGIQAMQMVEIAGIHNQKYQSLNVPIVFSYGTVLAFKSEDFDKAILGADSKTYDLKGIHSIEVRYSLNQKVRVWRTGHIEYLDNLKSLF